MYSHVMNTNKLEFRYIYILYYCKYILHRLREKPLRRGGPAWVKFIPPELDKTLHKPGFESRLVNQNKHDPGEWQSRNSHFGWVILQFLYHLSSRNLPLKKKTKSPAATVLCAKVLNMPSSWRMSKTCHTFLDVFFLRFLSWVLESAMKKNKWVLT